MKRTILAMAVVMAASAMLFSFVATAEAFPTRTTACSNCHSGVNVPVTATLASVSGASATYNFSAPTASAVAVFSGATKVATVLAATGQFAVPTGSTYTVFAVAGPTTGNGIGSTTVSPAAPPVDGTAPATTSDALTTYVGSATIHLTAIDNVGGSGVARTYYILDGAPQAQGMTVAVTGVATHSLEFWSVDVAGNIGTHVVANFSITAIPPVPDVTAPTTMSDARMSYAGTSTVHLIAVDNVGGSGVAHTYYILDNAVQAEGVAVVVSGLGAHTFEFWSVDVAGNVGTHVFATVTITAPPTTDMRPVWRFYNMHTGAHFYTSNEAEKDSVRAMLASMLRFEGIAYWVNVANPGNDTPLYRFYNVRTGSHFYTANADEKDSVIALYPSTYRFEGVAYSVSASPAGSPVYRFFNRRTGVHFFTANADERDSVIANYGSTYHFEGVAFYLAQ